MDKEQEALKKLGFDKDLEKKGLDLAHKLEKDKVPSDDQLTKEHKNLVEQEQELKELLRTEPVEDVDELGTFKPGKGVEEIPRMKSKK